MIEVLPDREAKTLARWLKAQPGVEIVSRDRSITYTEAITSAAPTAIQVADRFHLKLNLRTATEQFLRRNYLKIKTLLAPSVAPAPSVSAPQLTEETKNTKPLTAAQITKARQKLAGVEPT